MKIIKYKFLSAEINHGTEKKPSIEQIFLDIVMPCKTQAQYDASYAIAQKEAVGEITVEGAFDYVTAPRNIVAGEYVTIEGVLYLAIENIPNGEPIIVGQNATATTVEEQLYAMKGE